jgi:hypothetical protein
MQEFEPALAGSAGAAELLKRSKAKGFAAVDDIAERVGITNIYRSGGVTRTTEGFSAGGMLRFDEAVSPAQVKHMAHAAALQRGHRGFTMFTPDAKGSGVAHVLVARDKRSKILETVDEVFGDINDQRFRVSVGEDGAVVILNSSRQIKKKNLEARIARLEERLNVTSKETNQGSIEIKTASTSADGTTPKQGTPSVQKAHSVSSMKGAMIIFE